MSPSPPTRNIKEEIDMRRTYLKQFFGTNEAVEAGIRKFDQVLRRMYNVHGGRREASYKTPDGEYTVIMSYTANWMDSPRMRYLFPEYTIQAINRRFEREALRLANNDDFYCDVIKEIPDVDGWRRGEM